MSVIKKIQAVRITFSNGAVGEFIGPAAVSENEMANVTISNVELGHPEDFTEEIKAQLIGDENE